MAKPGIAIEIPNFPDISIRRIVTDYNGTLSQGGKVSPGVIERLRRLHALVEIDVITSDTFGTASAELAPAGLRPVLLSSDARHDQAKESHVKAHDAAHVAAFGNGNNDSRMLKAVKDVGGLAIAVDNGEGCSVQTLLNAEIFVVGIANALDLLLEPIRCKATLRR
ncbi:MAG TPA: ATPase P [Candidatus Dormibacteraeota bacterium]|nr:ATPase P [Candidatus Dormibacteraeota bacterium]